MLINDKKPYDEIKRTALIYSNKNQNSNRYYILQLEKTKDEKFNITFKYGRIGQRPRVITEKLANYYIACNVYNDKIIHLKRNKKYVEVSFFDIMENNTTEFFDFNEIEIIHDSYSRLY